MRPWPRVQWPRYRKHHRDRFSKKTLPALADWAPRARHRDGRGRRSRIARRPRGGSAAISERRRSRARPAGMRRAVPMTARWPIVWPRAHASAVGHGTETQRPQVLQQAEEDVDATVQGLPAAVHRVPVQQHRHHMPGGGLHHSRRVHVHIHRGQRRHHQDGLGPAAEQPHRHRGPAVGPGVQQPQQPGRFRGHSRAAAQVLPAPRHRGGAQLQLRGHQQGEHEPMVVRRRLPLLAVRHHHHRWIVCSIHILLGIYTYIPT